MYLVAVICCLKILDVFFGLWTCVSLPSKEMIDFVLDVVFDLALTGY
jgi:hypothetical protein